MKTGVQGAGARRRRALALVLVALLATAGFAALAQAYVDGGTLVELDLRVEAWVAGNMPGGPEWVARVFSWIGGVIGITIIVVGCLVALVRGRSRMDALFILVLIASVQIAVYVLKGAFDRPRPDAGSPIMVPHSASFPSGHAATGIAVFGALGIIAARRQLTRARAAIALVLGFGAGVAIGASRIVLNVHYVSDVLAGFCLGTAILAIALLIRDLLPERSK